ncbi:DUF5666 domain-containing protein [Kutzneria sp. CA-103260]|uniref:DUF5666 domain-containing protein n=1 Tax=Kutzneria sp. CA-103260 TaxID=2802641 RepID=UPI001BAA0B23|nr:DUF5666 domain-containing protein [Kutzneria sp. CA-103260]QUQ67341.1 hypothetical protein JJ691_50750 [Kutzneria sp. CA-103260]
MDTQQPAEGSEPVWGAAPQPQQPPATPDGSPQQSKRWSAGKTAAVVAVAAVVAAGGGYGISKLVDTGTANAATQGPGGFGAGGGGGFAGGRGGAGGIGGLLSALHGDFTVSDNGSYVTERLQTGEITAVSATSITAKSTDGYTQTYVIDSSTQVDEGNEQVSALKTGTTVTIIAKLSGGTGTATSISDQQMTGRGGFGGGAPGQTPGGTGTGGTGN